MMVDPVKACGPVMAFGASVLLGPTRLNETAANTPFAAQPNGTALTYSYTIVVANRVRSVLPFDGLAERADPTLKQQREADFSSKNGALEIANHLNRRVLSPLVSWASMNSIMTGMFTRVEKPKDPMRIPDDEGRLCMAAVIDASGPS